jgi:predicted RNase H-like HicB family nuclease
LDVFVHEEALAAACRLAAERPDWTFTADEVVRALPRLNASSVRTHVTSRCCVNAPKNHPHRWPYFKRIARGRYQVLPAFRRRSARRVARVGARAGFRDRARDVVHTVISRSGDCFVAECLEIAVVTQGRTIDETVANLREAIALHLEGDEAEALGLTSAPRIVVTYETALGAATA